MMRSAQQRTDLMQANGFHPERLSALIVDAGSHHRKLVAALLRGFGVGRLHTAENAEEALEAVRRHDPSFLIIEWEQDGGIDACALSRRIRLDRDLPNRAVPLIALTARAARLDVEAARNAGIDEYVVKPVSAASLQSRIQEVVLRPRPFIESATYVGPCRRRKQLKDYRGPFRRLTDPLDSEQAAPDDARDKARAKAVVNSIAARASGLEAGDRGKLKAVYTACREAEVCANDIADDPLRRSLASLIRYLEGVGASPLLERDVIDTHVEALMQLVMLPNAAVSVRDRVALGLEAVVAKKLRGGAGWEAASAPAVRARG